MSHTLLAATAMGALAVSTALASAQSAPVRLPPRVATATCPPLCPQTFPARDTANGAGSGWIEVWVTNPNGQQLYLGTAASLSWSTNNGASNVPIARAPGTLLITFMQNNTLFYSAYPQSCFQTGACRGGTTITIGQFGTAAPPSYTTYTLTVGVPPTVGGGVLAFPYQNLFMSGRVM